MDPKYFVELITRDDAAALKEEINNGLSPDSLIQGKSLIYCAVKSNKPQLTEMLLKAGAEIGKGLGQYPHAPLHTAVSGLHSGMVKLLIAYGADVNFMNESEGTLLHSMVQKNSNRAEVEIITDRLVLGGLDPSVKKHGWTALQKARAKNSALASRLVQYEPMAEQINEGDISREALLTAQSMRQTRCVWADLPGCWGYSEQIFDQLEARGEGLTRDELLQEDIHGISRACWIITAGHFDRLQAHLEHQGEEALHFGDFIQDKKATPLLQAIGDERGERELLQSSFFGGLRAVLASQLLHALPEPAQSRFSVERILTEKQSNQGTDRLGRE